MKPPKPRGPLMRWDVINELLTETPQKRFLEIGIQKGLCGKKVSANVKIGVDPNPIQTSRIYHKVHAIRSDAYFRGLPRSRQFDVVLVDGLHHAEQVERDVEHALRHLAPGGAIVMHDCSPATELQQRVPRQTGVWNGDVWKAMVRLRQRPDIDAFTIDADHGVGVVRPRPGPAALTGVPADPTYAELEANRQEWLGLVPAERWTERLGPPFAVGDVTVVSAIFGGRDEPRPVPQHHDVDRWIMFTDRDAGPGWERHAVETDEDPRRAARRCKALALELVPGDVVIWIDGRIQPTGAPVRQVLRRGLADADIAGFPHPWRSCLYDEARECAALGLAGPHKLKAQLDWYRRGRMPTGAGLWNTMVLARRRTDEMVTLGRAWWGEMQRHTLRDQISLPYLLWRDKIRCGRLGEDVYREAASAQWLRGWHV